MDNADERRLLRLLERLTEAMERISPPPVVVTAAPASSEATKDLAAAVQLRRRHVVDEADDRGLHRGGTDPKEFWSRKE